MRMSRQASRKIVPVLFEENREGFSHEQGAESAIHCALTPCLCNIAELMVSKRGRLLRKLLILFGFDRHHRCECFLRNSLVRLGIKDHTIASTIAQAVPVLHSTVQGGIILVAL